MKNPFIEAYVQSDFLGKLIFISLLLLSVITWIVIIYKFKVVEGAKSGSYSFAKKLEKERFHLLQFSPKDEEGNPFFSLFKTLKSKTLLVLRKNQHFTQEQKAVFLSSSDIDIVESHLTNTITEEIKQLEKHLYILSTIFSLGPLLGLLGTVWGIITTFSHLQAAGGGVNQQALGGISLALATTVLGLIDAIPAQVGYNYLKNRIREFAADMQCFSSDILASLEMQYRKADVE